VVFGPMIQITAQMRILVAVERVDFRVGTFCSAHSYKSSSLPVRASTSSKAKPRIALRQPILCTAEEAVEPQQTRTQLCNTKPAPGRYDQMPYRFCGRSRFKLPLLSLGLWHNSATRPHSTPSGRWVRTAFDLGMTLFDLANNSARRLAARRLTSAASCTRT
jgi:hypothetical protein